MNNGEFHVFSGIERIWRDSADSALFYEIRQYLSYLAESEDFAENGWKKDLNRNGKGNYSF